MAKVRKQTSPFEQSFMFHMIRDFFLLLVLVATVSVTANISFFDDASVSPTVRFHLQLELLWA